MADLNPDERVRLLDYAHDEHELGMRCAAAFLYGRAAALGPGPVFGALWEAATEIEKMAREQRKALRDLVRVDAARYVMEGLETT